MTETFFAYTNIDEIRDEYYMLEDYTIYEDDTCVIGCDKTLFAQDETTAVAIFGEIFNIDEFGYDTESHTDAQIILKLLEDIDPSDFCKMFTGCFTIFVYEKDYKSWMLITDAMGTYYPFYYIDDDEFIIFMNLSDFKSDLFDFNVEGMHKLFDTNDFRETETPIDGVYKLSEGTILSWPEQSLEKYIDMQEELEHAYNNKIDISVTDAIDQIDGILRKTVEVTSRRYDKSKIGVELEGGIDGIVAASTLNSCGIKPQGYSVIFPPQEDLPRITAKKADAETKRRQQAFVKLDDKMGLVEKNNEIICDYDNIEKHLTHTTVKNPHATEHWAKFLFYGNEIGKAAQNDDISCIYNGDMGDIIFLNQMQSYILYQLSKDGEEFDIDDISDDQIREMFGDIIHDSSNYIFTNIIDLPERLRDFIKKGFVNYIIEMMNDRKGYTTDRDSRIEWEIPRIDIFKNHKLLSFILSLPDEILSESILNASLQKGVVAKQQGKKSIRWALQQWKAWNFHDTVIFDKKIEGVPYRAPIKIKHTEKTRNEWDSAIEMLRSVDVGCNTMWHHEIQQTEYNSDVLETGAFKIIMSYRWLKSWLN